jgi:hypothetical protein
MFLKRERPTGDPAVDDENGRRFRAKLKILDMLNTYPEHCLRVQERLQDDVLGLSSLVKSQGADVLFDNRVVKKIGKIEPAWKSDYLIRHYSEHCVQLALVTALNKFCPDTLVQASDFLHGVNPDVSMTDEMLDKVVFERVMRRRALDLGRAVPAFFNELEACTGRLFKWSEFGCYKLEKSGDGYLVVHDGSKVPEGKNTGPSTFSSESPQCFRQLPLASC